MTYAPTFTRAAHAVGSRRPGLDRHRRAHPRRRHQADAYMSRGALRFSARARCAGCSARWSIRRWLSIRRQPLAYAFKAVILSMCADERVAQWRRSAESGAAAGPGAARTIGRRTRHWQPPSRKQASFTDSVREIGNRRNHGQHGRRRQARSSPTGKGAGHFFEKRAKPYPPDGAGLHRRTARKRRRG